MPVCFDTGQLLKLYVQEKESPQAIALAVRAGPVCFTDFHRAEFTNALHCKLGRREITPVDLAKALADVEADLHSGALLWMQPNWKQVFAATARLSTSHSAGTLCRTLDAMHVALAQP